MSDVLTTVGEAVLDTTFKLHGRGTVLVLDTVEGVVPSDGKVWNGSALVPYIGPDFMDGQNLRSRLTITIADADLGKLCQGSALRFTQASKTIPAG